MKSRAPSRSWIMVAMLAACSTVTAPAAETPTTTGSYPIPAAQHSFFEANCFDCHGDTEQKAGLRLDTLAADFSNPNLQRTWIEVFDKVSKGEMPPKKKPRPPEADTKQMLGWLKEGITAADMARRNADGRVVMRRLNRTEYQNTIHDLLGIDTELKDSLPDDSSAMGFDNVADALRVSSVLVERYLEAADMALDAALPATEPPKAQHWEFPYAPEFRDPKDWRLGTGNKFLPDGSIVFFGTYGGNLPIRCERFAAPSEGKYHIRVAAYAYQSDKPLIASILAGSFDPRVPKRKTVGYFDIPPGADKPLIIDFTERLPQKGTFKVQPYRLRGHNQMSAEKSKVYAGPGIALGRVEIDGPLNGPWPSESERRILGDVDPKKGSGADVAKILLAFAGRAFRRPVEAAEVSPYVDLVKSRLDAGEPFIDAVRVGLKTILCSSNFLFLHEKPGRLDDYAIAARLAYFLWSSMPDDELMKLAANHTLTRPEVLRAQTERLLNDPRAEAFTENFTGQWLSLRQINATQPDTRFYPGFDDLLQWSMVQETTQFFDDLLKTDGSIVNFVDSDYAMLNGTLAELYSIKDIEGATIRKVALPPGSHRGGLLAQAAILKVTANGTNTSPVVRGAWVMRNLVGRPPKPPPPDVPAIEPDTRGATTIREQLAKHRNQPACAACHANIDPPGFAMESFDVIGGYRANYHQFGGGLKVQQGYYGPASKLVVDPSGALADGRDFKNFDDFKKLLLTEKDPVARCLTEKLLIYATGGGLDFADRPAVDAIVQHLREHGYGLRTLVHEVVESPVFLTK